MVSNIVNMILTIYFRAVRGGDPRCHRRGGLEAREGGRDPDRRGPRRRRGQGEERAAGATPPLRHERIRKGQLGCFAEMCTEMQLIQMRMQSYPVGTLSYKRLIWLYQVFEF